MDLPSRIKECHATSNRAIRPNGSFIAIPELCCSLTELQELDRVEYSTHVCTHVIGDTLRFAATKHVSCLYTPALQSAHKLAVSARGLIAAPYGGSRAEEPSIPFLGEDGRNIATHTVVRIGYKCLAQVVIHLLQNIWSSTRVPRTSLLLLYLACSEYKTHSNTISLTPDTSAAGLIRKCITEQEIPPKGDILGWTPFRRRYGPARHAAPGRLDLWFCSQVGTKTPLGKVLPAVAQRPSCSPPSCARSADGCIFFFARHCSTTAAASW